MPESYENYLKKLKETYLGGDATEPSYYPALKEFLENYAEEKGHKITVTANPSKTDSGMPDFLIKTKKGKIVGYIEAKDITEKDLEKISQSEQLQRYREGLPNLILTNFFDFYFFRNGEIQHSVNIADSERLLISRKQPIIQNIEGFGTLLEKFFSFSIPRLSSAKNLAEELAKRTKLLSNAILKELENENPNLLGLYEVFKDELIKSASDQDFADLYAQTITYGLFFARTQSTEKEFSRITAYEYIPGTIPLLQRLFYLLTGPTNLPESLKWILDDLVNVLTSSDLSSIMKEFHTKMWTEDPVIHFYESFLAEYNPEKRERKGVYYTPSPVVSYIIGSLHNILKVKFDRPNGLADRKVTLLDPAAGTLTFLTTAMRLVQKEYKEKGKLGIFSSLVKEHLLKDFYAFELLLAPYAIGHFKANTVLEDLGYKLEDDERFQFYLTNTLEMKEPGQAEFFPVLAEEGERAKEIKESIPILVVCGNPPYSVSSDNKSDFIEGLMNDYKEDVRDEKNIQPLSDDYIKFIRFSQWRVNKTGKGIVGLITNNSYLEGIIHRGMRKKLLETFDEIYILNLHGSSRIGEKTPTGRKDQNVFDIQQGVAIAIYVKHEEQSKEKKIYYADLWGLREEKYKYLSKNNIHTTTWQELKPEDPYFFFVPKTFTSKDLYDKFWNITKIFKESQIGLMTGQDAFFVDINSQTLKIRILKLFDRSIASDSLKELYNFDSQAGDKTIKARDSTNFKKELILPYCYRPFDIRYVYAENKFLWRSVEALKKHLIQDNIALVSTRILARLPFYHIFVAQHIGDNTYISSKTKERNYFFPLYLYQDKKRKFNLSNGFLKTLKNGMKKEPIAEDIFYYIYAVLHTPNYRTKYGESLKIDFPRIPFTKDYNLFKKIADFGKILVELHLLKSPLLQKLQATFPKKGNDVVKIRKYAEKNSRVYINDAQYFGNIPKEVWMYPIGSYQVLDKWIKDRKDRKLSLNEIETYCKIVSSIKHTIKIMEKIDKLYDQVEKDLIEYAELNQNHKLSDFEN